MNIKKKISKFLNKNVTVTETILSMLAAMAVSFGILCIIIHPFRSYSYVTNNNEYGQSNHCYKYKDTLVCEVRMNVKQYYIN